VPQGTDVRVSVHNPFRDSTLTVYGLHAHPAAEELTRTGVRLLTPEYASPEQVRGEAVTTASDV